MADVRLVGTDGKTVVNVTPDGKLSVDAQVNVQDSKVKGSPDGGTTWVPLKAGADGTLYAQLSGSNEYQSRVWKRTGTLNANTAETLVDIPGRPVSVDAVTIGSDSANIVVLIYPYLADNTLGDYMRVAGTDGFTYAPSVYTVELFAGGQNDFFRRFVYDTTNGKYSMGLSRGFAANNGAKIVIQNNNGVARNVAAAAWISEYL